MMIEIERKFLVRGDFPRTDGTRIVQGYLSRVPERTVRVRIMHPVSGEGDGTSGEEDVVGGAACNIGRGYITIKGVSDTAGVSRFEWEHEIAVEEALVLLKLAEPGIIEKTRWRVPVASRRSAGGHHVFEVDEFKAGGGCGDEVHGSGCSGVRSKGLFEFSCRSYCAAIFDAICRPNRGTMGFHCDEGRVGNGAKRASKSESRKFQTSSKGLILAEIELSSADEHFERPAWLGDEVTGDARYYNAAL